MEATAHICTAECGAHGCPAVVIDRLAARRTAVLVSYWSGDHSPYPHMLHDDHDENIEQARWDGRLRQAIDECGAVDGDEIEIVVRRTGRRPFGDRKYRLIEPHTYRREEESPCPNTPCEVATDGVCEPCDDQRRIEE